jgi:phage terminase small subunit
MNVLKEPRHERFAQAIAAGKSLHLASQLAGYLQPAYALARDPVIQARVAELLKDAATDAVMQSREWQERETRSARVDIRALFNMQTGLLLPMSEWPDDAAEAVESIEYDKFGMPKIKLRKTGSMNNLGKNLRMLTDKVELSGPNDGPLQTITNTMTPQEAAEAYAAMLNPGK